MILALSYACFVLCAMQVETPRTAPSSPAAQKKPSASPGPRRAHTLAYDEARDLILLFGGAGAETGLDTTWSWKDRRWKALEVDGPSARRGSLSVYDVAHGRVVLLGGQAGDDPTSAVFDETWLWDGKSWSKSTGASPGARVHFAAAYDRNRSRLVLVGGLQPATGKDRADVWEWQGSEWKSLEVAAPAALFAPQMAFDEGAKLLVLTSTLLPDQKLMTWTFDGAGFKQVDASGPQVIASGQSLVTLGASGGVLLFGGSDGKALLADTWKWDGKKWNRLDLHGPSARVGHAMVYDRKRDRVVLYGGEDGQQTFDDQWEFVSGAWKQVK